MPPLIPDEDGLDEPYDSAEDEDFQLDEAGDDAREDSGLSSSDSEDGVTGQPAKKRRKRSANNNKGAESDDKALDSGDEVTIRKAQERRKKRKGGKKSGGREEDEEEEDDINFDGDGDEAEGGQGGFVKTRSMRMRL